MESEDVDVLIVGAGAAGIGAARTLHHLDPKPEPKPKKAGSNKKQGKRASDAPAPEAKDEDSKDEKKEVWKGKVVVLEARDRVGGRTWLTDEFGGPIDLGASWVEGYCARNPMKRLADAHDFPPLTQKVAKHWELYDADEKDPDKAVPDEFAHVYQNAVHKLLQRSSRVCDEKDKDMSVFDGFRDEYDSLAAAGPLQRRLLDYFLNRTEQIEGAPFEELSGQHWQDGQGFEEGGVPVVGGYAKLISTLSTPLDVRLNHPVSHIITYSPSGAVVAASPAVAAASPAVAAASPAVAAASPAAAAAAADAPVPASPLPSATARGVLSRLSSEWPIGVLVKGKLFRCRHIVVTVPLALLKREVIEIYPPLPADKRAAIDRLGLSLMNKIVLEFKTPFWHSTARIMGIVSQSKGEFPFFLNVSETTQRPVLVGLFSGLFAREMEGLSDDAIVSRCLAQLRKVFGDKVEAPIRSFVTRWGKDPYAGQSWTFLKVGSSGKDCKLLSKPIKLDGSSGSLSLAGEAVTSDHLGTVHGAYITGTAAAEAILEKLSKQ